MKIKTEVEGKVSEKKVRHIELLKFRQRYTPSVKKSKKHYKRRHKFGGKNYDEK